MLTLGKRKTPPTGVPSIAPPPRAARFRGRVYGIGVSVPVLCLIAAWLALRSENQALDQLQEIVVSGEETPGSLIGRRTRRSGRRTEHLVTYRYLVGERAYTGQVDSKFLFDAYPQRRNVVVSYSIADPSLARIGSRQVLAQRRERNLGLRWWAPGLLVAVGASILFYWQRMRRYLRLAQDGTARWGTLVSGKRRGRNSGRVTVTIDDSQGTATRRFWSSGAFVRDNPPGTAVAILSDAEDAETMALYDTVAASIDIEAATMS